MKKVHCSSRPFGTRAVQEHNGSSHGLLTESDCSSRISDTRAVQEHYDSSHRLFNKQSLIVLAVRIVQLRVDPPLVVPADDQQEEHARHTYSLSQSPQDVSSDGGRLCRCSRTKRRRHLVSG